MQNGEELSGKAKIKCIDLCDCFHPSKLIILAPKNPLQVCMSRITVHMCVKRKVNLHVTSSLPLTANTASIVAAGAISCIEKN